MLEFWLSMLRYPNRRGMNTTELGWCSYWAKKVERIEEDETNGWRQGFTVNRQGSFAVNNHLRVKSWLPQAHRFLGS